MIIFFNSILQYFERKAFGVCTWWANVLGIKANTVRMYFIYLSFFTVGSPIIIYFIMAFVKENKSFFTLNFLRKKRKTVWDLD